LRVLFYLIDNINGDKRKHRSNIHASGEMK